MSDIAPDVVEEVDKNVPDVEESIEPDPPKPDPEPGETLEAIVMELKEKVDTLIAQAAAPVPTPGEPGDDPGSPADENPVRKPWTHRGFFGS